MQAEARPRGPRPTVADWHRKPIIQLLSISPVDSWEQIQMANAYVDAAPEQQVSPDSASYNLLMVLDGTLHRTGYIASEKGFHDALVPGSLQLHPPHLEVYSTWDAPSTMSFVELSPQLIEVLADETFRGDPHHLELAPNLNFQDPFLQALVDALSNEVNEQNPFGALYAASISQTMILHLLQKYAKLTKISANVTHRFSPEQTRLIEEYLDVHLSNKIALSDLADLLHISISHFERIFRATFGQPPYQYVIEQRVERAKQLLSSQDYSLLEIAQMCGFANQSHLTRHFTRIVRITPARFARYSNR